MIPLRIKLSGLLSYRDEQDITFAGSSLWMLAGVNGSGKSSVFDGVTYALFGSHRGGTQNAGELIHKDASALSVEFDFHLDERTFRIRRTLKRSPKGAMSSTQQVYQRHVDADAVTERWEPVPDTTKKVDFDRWVAENVGLTYETFTSSVLLLQGKAEKLLDAKPSGRAEVLAGIVDLARYQRLHEKANTRRLALKGQQEALTHQTAAIPEVTPADLAQVEEAIGLAQQQRQAGQECIDLLISRAEEARRWSDLQKRLNAAKDRLAHAEHLLADAVKIEKAHTRFQELADVLPAVNTVVTMRARQHDSDLRTQRWQKERTQATEQKHQAQHALELARNQRAALQQTLHIDEQKLGQATARLRELAAILQAVHLADEQARLTQDLESRVRQFPVDLEATWQRLQHEAEALRELAIVVPILERITAERVELRSSITRETEGHQQAEQKKREGQEARTTYDALLPRLQAASEARTRADEAATTASVVLQQARQAVNEFTQLAGAPNCSTCGQPLTPEHFDEERTRREHQVQAALRQHAQAVEAQQQALANESRLKEAEAAARQHLDHLREAYKECMASVRQAATDIDRHVRVLAIARGELPEGYHKHLPYTTDEEWAASEYPTGEFLQDLATRAAAWPKHQREQEVVTKQRDAWRQLQTQIQAARQTLDRLQANVPAGDSASLKAEQTRLQSEEHTLKDALRSTKTALQKLETEIDRHGADAHQATTTLTELVGKLQNEQTTQELCRETVERAMSGLPHDWQMRVEKAGLTEYATWKGELDQLSADGVPDRYKLLEQSRGGLETMRADIASLSTETERFPAEVRCPPETLAAELATAREALESLDKQLAEAQRRKAVLEGHLEHRRQLGDQFQRVDLELNRYKLLAELLGRDRLQRHLVRKAERQIVDYANGILDRLSGGELYLRLSGSEDGSTTDKALDLECLNRITGGSPINVAFLSGSQKFRVAVSLALGIGQYASKQHRPIESVIIDEGFGCLDRQGRQVMIQELQNLRGHLRCILLVSHQEEFADAFPDGYRFELQNGATRVTRFQR